VKYNYENYATCPYCGEIDRDSWEIDFGPALIHEGKAENTCGSCNKNYIVERHCSVTYSSEEVIVIPKACMDVYQTKEAAEHQSKQRIDSLLDDTPASGKGDGA
jgi:hypothetical protein